MSQKQKDMSKDATDKGTLSFFKPSPALFREIQLFKAFTEAELEGMVLSGTTLDFEAHTNVVIEGEPSWGLYIILNGMIGIYKSNRMNETLYEVAQLGSGSFFGEMSFLDENPRSATVKTLTDTRLFYLSKDSFSKFIESSTDLKLRFYSSSIQALVKRLRTLDENYVISQYQLWQSLLRKENSSK